MLSSTGAVKNICHNHDSYLSSSAFFNGIYRYTQVAIILGMNATHHSRFIVNYLVDQSPTVPRGTEHPTWEKAGEFVWNEAGRNRAEQKLQYLANNPGLRLIADVDVNQTRPEWPGAIVIPLIDIANPDTHAPDCVLQITNSGVPAFFDIVLCAAFAIGIKQIGYAWDLCNFNTNSQYAEGLNLAARFITLASGFSVRYLDSIEDNAWHTWFDQQCELPIVVPVSQFDILQDALNNLDPRPSQSSSLPVFVNGEQEVFPQFKRRDGSEPA